MTTLSAAVDAGTGSFPVTGGLPAIQARPFLALVDSEQVEVVAAGLDAWLVRRARNGTLAVAHNNGATLSPLYNVEASTAPFTSPMTLLLPIAGQPSQYGIQVYEAAFVAAGAGTYTATLAIPAGATVRDVVFRSTVVWDNATSASMTCGDDDSATGYYSATNVKSSPAADTNGAGAGLSTQLSLGASAGSYKGGAGKYCAVAKTLTCTIVTVGAGSAGRSRLIVVLALPSPIVPVQS